MTLGLAVVAPALIHVGAVHAHVGELYRIPQLTDDDLARLDLHDGSVEDWLEVVGAPLLRSADFAQGDGVANDPGSLEVRVWLAWHDDPDRIYLAVEATDDAYRLLHGGRLMLRRRRETHRRRGVRQAGQSAVWFCRGRGLAFCPVREAAPSTSAGRAR